ncbi:MAG: SH3 domain-containing protein [Verrucomicrobiota bacterium]
MNARPSSILQVALWFCLWLVAATRLLAEDSSGAFNEANKLFEQGKYSEAAAGYEKIIQGGTVSAPIYFNLGNTFLKSGHAGRAIVAYRNAAQLSPRDPDVRANLQFAREQVRGKASSSRDYWKNGIARLTLNEWTLLASSALGILFLFLAARQWRGDWKNSFRGPIALLALGTVAFIGCLMADFNYQTAPSSVVIVPEAVVRSGPFDESPSAFTLRDGSEVVVLDKKEDWLQIADSGQRSGWSQAKNLVSPNAATLKKR